MVRILILGGTQEGRQLAEALSAAWPQADIITALAGATAHAKPLAGRVRVGGFGGAEGLAQYIKGEDVDMVIDATHPFAQRITQSALSATTQTQTPYLRIDRPQWTMPLDADVIYVPDATEAARLIARTSRSTLLTIGRKALSAFAGIDKLKLVVRVIDTPTPDPLHGKAIYIEARPPFALDDEIELMRAHNIDTLVTKASGGDGTRAKLDAAAQVGARIVAIRRPAPPQTPCVTSVDAAMAWVEHQLT